MKLSEQGSRYTLDARLRLDPGSDNGVTIKATTRDTSTSSDDNEQTERLKIVTGSRRLIWLSGRDTLPLATFFFFPLAIHPHLRC